ncbi:MAG TPA: hypothetical protein VGI05_23630 [Streptosporangiaceae bacterium]
MTQSEPPDPPGQERPGPASPGPGTPDPPSGIPGISGIPGAPGRFRPGFRRAADPWQLWIHRAEQIAASRAQHMPIPAWVRKTPGERRWPVTASVVVAITLQLLLPPHLTEPLPRALLPVLEGALLVGLSIANPVRIERRGKPVRAASIALIVLMTIANAASAVLLIHAIVRGKPVTSAGPLLASGASIWTTNVIAFALWYWEFDRGGPVNRALGTSQLPDLLFTQMAVPELAPPDWEPRFVDYLYLSFTNATAFSPTDVMPMARWAKLTMLVQSAVSLAVGVLVIARAVNILPL